MVTTNEMKRLLPEQDMLRNNLDSRDLEINPGVPWGAQPLR
jgi:hypothetical protein